MTDHSLLPNWVKTGDGRTEPFDGDRISRALFVAGERIGRENPFLARELTDGVLHFLAVDGTADPISKDELVETVVKIVRELGHPALAVAFKNDCATDFGSRSVRDGVPRSGTWSALAPDLSAAERDGLLHFFDIESPLELAGVVLPQPSPADGSARRQWVDVIQEARELAGQYIAIDGPEYTLAGSEAAANWAPECRAASRASGLKVVINLNVTEPPSLAPADGGPLFGSPSVHDRPRRTDVAEAIAEHVLNASADSIRVDWHLGENDFQIAARERLVRLARRVLDGAQIAFVPDRPTRPVALAEGLDRRHRAVLAVVGVGLPRLLDIVTPANGAMPEAAAVLAKLGSLARLALGAGRAQREFLRRNAGPVIAREFLLDRARLVIVPVGLMPFVRAATGHFPAESGESLEFACHVLNGLHAAVRLDASRGPAIVDDLPPLVTQVADDAGCQGVSARQQLRAAAVLQATVGTGTVVVCLPTDRRTDPEEVTDLLWYAWQQPGLVRVRFAAAGPLRQQAAGW